MENFELIFFPSDRELAQAAAGAWLDAVQSANQAQVAHCAALSGGRIARTFFTSAVAQGRARKIAFDPVHFFWADERCVPPHDPESNFRVAQELLFDPLGIAADHIHRIRGEAPPEFAAVEAEAEMSRIAPSNSDGLPTLDLIFLGLGEDGHIASLFPRQPEPTGSKKAVYRAITHSPKPPPARISLTYGAIAAARQVWVLASGAGKEQALRESLRPDAQTPLARVLNSRLQTRILSDFRV